MCAGGVRGGGGGGGRGSVREDAPYEENGDGCYMWRRWRGTQVREDEVGDGKWSCFRRKRGLSYEAVEGQSRSRICWLVTTSYRCNSSLLDCTPSIE
ncbi:hypothetical protein TIFTF001_004359 [Ficus carica]|uniref:Uncharacterized protein n=1 Tax=Ficus carica TaxID=3494 RepID=A0AA87ZIB9_FICCA|nr:hypothetical protein TIFTF001_004359 [Ficus carica]